MSNYGSFNGNTPFLSDHIYEEIKRNNFAAMVLTDNDKMSWGSHKDKLMKDVPHGWFIYMHDRGKLSGPVKQYAEENVPILKFVAEKKKNK